MEKSFLTTMAKYLLLMLATMLPFPSCQLAPMISTPLYCAVQLRVVPCSIVRSGGQAFCRKRDHRPGLCRLVMQTRKALCGLWTLNYKVESEKGTANVWLEEGGNMRPVTVKNQHGGSELEQVSTTAAPVLCAGRWSVQQSSVLLYHCKKGELSHSWSGRLVEQQLGNETANMSRTILDGIIQQGDSDPEFAGRFDARQILAAFTPEELLEEEFAKSKSPVPRYSMEHLTGIWKLYGDLYDDPFFMSPVHLYEDGTFEFAPDNSHRFAGRWGLHRDGPEESVQENREQGDKHRGSRREGTHFWMWAQRAECLGFNMNADYRIIGRMSPLGIDDQLQLSIVKKSAEAGGARMLAAGGGAEQMSIRPQASAGGGEGGRGGEFRVPLSVRVAVKGVIFWGNIADMEYSDLAGRFSLSPVLPESNTQATSSME